jgi:hypothetical protein
VSIGGRQVYIEEKKTMGRGKLDLELYFVTCPLGMETAVL